MSCGGGCCGGSCGCGPTRSLDVYAGRDRGLHALPPAEGRTQSSSASATRRQTSCSSGRPPAFTRTSRATPSSARRGSCSTSCWAASPSHAGDVYIANVIKCRPPGNRDPMQDEIEACESHLFHQVELIQPRSWARSETSRRAPPPASRLGITRVHGQEQEVTLGGRQVLLYPLYHPAAALYTRSMMKVLQADFARIPKLLGRVVGPTAEPSRCSSPSPRFSSASSSLVVCGEAHMAGGHRSDRRELASELRAR